MGAVGGGGGGCWRDLGEAGECEAGVGGDVVEFCGAGVG
jgi:hypothetical protein